jgi:hypothetical protein
MVYRIPRAAPASQIAAERRGRVVARFCHVCSSLYPLHRSAHSGHASYGKDHIASPCAHEGDAFADGASWWEDAVEVLPAPPAGDPAVAGSPLAGTGPEAKLPPAPAPPAAAAGPAPAAKP